MIRLSSKDEKAFLDYISKDPELCLFFYGDVANYGFDKSVCQVYASYSEDKITSLVLQYRNTMFQFYSKDDDFDVKEVTDFLTSRKISVLSGKTSLIKEIAPYLGKTVIEETYIARCFKVNPDFKSSIDKDVVLKDIPSTDEEDITKVVELVRTIDEFASVIEKKTVKESVAVNKENIELGSHIIGAFINGEVVATAATTATSDQSAMLVSVCTRKGYRGKGLASSCVLYLCNEVFKEGKKSICLFYDNPDAGKIYHKIGFEDFEKYAMLRKA